METKRFSPFSLSPPIDQLGQDMPCVRLRACETDPLLFMSYIFCLRSSAA